MIHARNLIRTAIAELLAVAPIKYSAVIASRVPPLRQLWPYLLVFAENEQITSADVNEPCTYLRALNVTVIAMLRMANGNYEGIEDEMDTVSAEIENKITFAAMRAKQPAVQDIKLITTDLSLVANIDDSTIDHAELTLIWRIDYATREGAAETLI